MDDRPDPSHDGHLTETDGRHILRFVRSFDASITEVWQAITDSDRLARWAFPGTLEQRVGGSVRFDYGDAGEGLGTVLRWDEPTLLEYEWGEGETRWHIRFALSESESGGTTLTFDHLLPDATRAEFAAGWHWHLDRLTTVLHGDQPADVGEDDHFRALLSRYRDERGSVA
jgi:uncharacterized protein YndB with AHSA1/START domain